MKFSSPVPVNWIAELTGATLTDKSNGMVTGINEIHKVEPGDIVFVDHPKYYEKCVNSAASFIIINRDYDCPDGKAILVAQNPFEAYCRIVNHFRPFEPGNKLLSDSATIGK